MVWEVDHAGWGKERVFRRRRRPRRMMMESALMMFGKFCVDVVAVQVKCCRHDGLVHWGRCARSCLGIEWYSYLTRMISYSAKYSYLVPGCGWPTEAG